MECLLFGAEKSVLVNQKVSVCSLRVVEDNDCIRERFKGLIIDYDSSV